MQEVGSVLKGSLLPLDVMEKGLELRHLVVVSLFGIPGFLEIPKQGAFFDLQGLEPEAQGMGGRLADLGDFLFKEVEFLLGLGDIGSEGLGDVEFPDHDSTRIDSYPT